MPIYTYYPINKYVCSGYQTYLPWYLQQYLQSMLTLVPPRVSYPHLLRLSRITANHATFNVSYYDVLVFLYLRFFFQHKL